MRDLKNKSRFLALILRHNPEKANISLDKNGWADIDELLVNTDFSEEDLDALVNVPAGEKKRYEFNPEKTAIRAVQGHSIKHIDTELPVRIPPPVLFHGTNTEVLPIILKQGLKPMSRKHVHLAPDKATALTVGSRKRGATVALLEIDTREMVKKGVKFYYAESVKTWLTDFVAPEFISIAR
jgi:putative RNA 2'-phosphotransferase